MRRTKRRLFLPGKLPTVVPLERYEQEVEGIRSGRVPDPAVSQLTTLADAFGVAPSWFLVRDVKPLLLDEELVEALRNETSRAILREVARLPERERRIVLGIVRQFEDQQDATSE